MKFPLVNSKTHYGCTPQNGRCPICSKPFNGDFVTVNGGALKVINAKEATMFAKGEAEVFLGLNVHKDSTKTYGEVTLAERNRAHGQFEISACSIRCMRKLINRWLDAAEKLANTKS